MRALLCPTCDGSGSYMDMHYESIVDDNGDLVRFEPFPIQIECQWCDQFSSLFIRRKESVHEWLEDFKYFLEVLHYHA